MARSVDLTPKNRGPTAPGHDPSERQVGMQVEKCSANTVLKATFEHEYVQTAD